MEIDNIQINLRKIQQRIDRACKHSHRKSDDIKIVAVTKTMTSDIIRSAFQCGIKDFGENRIQEASAKIEELSDLRSDITWHMVGHVQTNKAKSAAKDFDFVHSVDSLKLAHALDRHASKILPILLEVNVSGEETKQGLAPNQVNQIVEEIKDLPNLELKGLMTIAPWADDPEDVRLVFKKLRQLRDALGLEHLSMGMTDDFEVAIEEGATIIRIGRAIFGDRR